MKYHFISGLPRAGSTLLAGILRQNPRFHAAITSPVGGLFTQMQRATSVVNETSAFMDEDKKRRLLKSVFDVWYDDMPDKQVIFDTNRQWSARLPQLRQLLPDSKIICCVRNVAWVMDSFERLYRRNAFYVSQIYSNAARETVYTRVEALAQYDGVVGYGWAAVKDAYYSDEADNMLVVDYDLLAQAPEKTIELIYQFLGEAPFQHDFANVEYAEPEFDKKLGAPGLHAVRKKVEFKPRRTILPPDLFQRYAQLGFWHDQSNSRASVIAPKPEAVDTDRGKTGISDLQKQKESGIA